MGEVAGLTPCTQRFWLVSPPRPPPPMVREAPPRSSPSSMLLPFPAPANVGLTDQTREQRKTQAYASSQVAGSVCSSRVCNWTALGNYLIILALRKILMTSQHPLSQWGQYNGPGLGWAMGRGVGQGKAFLWTRGGLEAEIRIRERGPGEANMQLPVDVAAAADRFLQACRGQLSQRLTTFLGK